MFAAFRQLTVAHARAAVRAMHASAVLQGGRNDNALATRLGATSSSYGGTQSKKAKKRQKLKRASDAKRGGSRSQFGAMGGEAGSAATGLQRLDGSEALQGGGSGGSGGLGMPSAADLAAASVVNRRAIESMLLSEEPGVRARDALEGQDAAAWLAAARASGSGLEGAKAWTHAVRVLGAQGRYLEALSAFADMRAAGHPPSAHAYTALLVACGVARNPAAAREVWRSWEEEAAQQAAGRASGTATSTSAAASSSSSSRGQHQLQLQQPSSLQPPPPLPSPATWPYAWGALMQAHVRGGDLEGALGALKAAGTAQVPLSATLWTHLITGANAAGLYEMAEACFHQMRTFHAPPDAVAFTALITSLGRRDQWEAAQAVLWDMRDSGCAPTTVTFNALTHAAARSWRSAHAAHGIAASMAAAGAAKDAATYSALLLACSHGGEVERARDYVADMLRAGLPLSLQACNTLITVYARALTPRALRQAAAAHAAQAAAARAVTASGAPPGATDLLAMDAAGLLSSSRGGRGGLPGTFKSDGAGGASEARLVDTLDLTRTAEQLLADYYGVSVGEAEEGAQDEAALAAAEGGVGGEGDESAAVGRFLSEVPAPLLQRRADNEQYAAGMAALVEAGVADARLVAGEAEGEVGGEGLLLGQEGGRTARRRGREVERERARVVAEMEAEVVQLAQQEAALAAAAAAAGSAEAQEAAAAGKEEEEVGGSEGSAFLQLKGTSSVFGDVAEHVRSLVAVEGEGALAVVVAGGGVGGGPGGGAPAPLLCRQHPSSSSPSQRQCLPPPSWCCRRCRQGGR